MGVPDVGREHASRESPFVRPTSSPWPEESTYHIKHIYLLDQNTDAAGFVGTLQRGTPVETILEDPCMATEQPRPNKQSKKSCLNMH